MDEDYMKSLMFYPKEKNEVIKVPNCGYENDTKIVSTFYFCQCSEEDFEPICEACIKECHQKHSFSLTIKGIYKCRCGEKNHLITSRANDVNEARKRNKENKCIFATFFAHTSNNGFYTFKGKSYCAVCVYNCRSSSSSARTSMQNDMDGSLLSQFHKESANHHYKCHCRKHFDTNINSINLDFISKPKTNEQFENFNFNILAKKDKYDRDVMGKKYILPLLENVKAYRDNPTADQAKKFFLDFIIQRILELFSFFSVNWENKFFFIQDHFKDIDPRVLINLMMLSENPAEMEEGVKGTFFKSKFYYAELIFNYFIRRFNIKYNNLWNIRTLLNMNLYQRKLYIQDNKLFYKYHGNYSVRRNEEGEEEEEWNKKTEKYQHELINDLITNLLDIYDNMLKINETADKSVCDLENIILSEVFPTFTRIFKYLIKYHFVNYEQSCKFFELVFDTIKIRSERKDVKDTDDESNDKNDSDDNNDVFISPNASPLRRVKHSHIRYQSTDEFFTNKRVTFNDRQADKILPDLHITKPIIKSIETESTRLKGVLHIMKSILYCLIYNNDKVCLNYLKYKKDSNNHLFTFITNDTSDKMCKIFMSIINLQHRNQSLSHTIIYDFYVRKILELLTKKSDFYILSLKNLKSIPLHELKLITSNDPYEDAMKYLHEPYLRKLSIISKKLHDLNRKYFDYVIQIPEWINKFNTIIAKDLKKFIAETIQYIPNLHLKYLTFGKLNNDNLIERIDKFQEAVKYTNFFQVIEECAHIYTEGKRFLFENDQPKINIDMKVQANIFTFILQTLYLLIYKNQENFCLFMNIKSKLFINTFINSNETIFFFFDRMSEMMYQINYDYDNYYFFSECLCYLVKNSMIYFETEQRSYEKDMIKIGYIAQVFKLVSKWINRITINQPDLLNVIDSLQNFIIAANKSDSKFNDLIPLLNDYVTGKAKNDKRIGLVIGYYIMYLVELIENDSDFYGRNCFKCFLFDIASLLNKPNNLFNKSFSIELEYAIIRLYFSSEISFKFSFGTINNQLLKLFESFCGDENCISNVSLPYLSIPCFTSSQAEIDSELRKNIEKYKKYANFLLILNQKFRERFADSYAMKNNYPCFIMVKIFLFQYFERMLVRPIYKLINYLMLHGAQLDGADCIPFQKLIYEFMRNVVFFYDTINKSIDFQYKKEHKDHYQSCENSKEIYEYENISLNLELTYSNLQEILSDMNELKTEVKYYHFDKQYEILMKTIERIFKVKPENLESLKTNTSNSIKKMNELFIMDNSSDIKRTAKLIKKYENKKENSYDNRLSLFNAIEASEKEMDSEIIKEILVYLLSKLSDQLSDQMVIDKPEIYVKGDISDISLENLKLQNSYVLIYLNALFFNYSKNYQESCAECLGAKFTEVFEFLSKDLIFYSSLSEIAKIYQLDCIKNYNQTTGERVPSLSYEICTLSIKLLQNFCEAHNQTFQNRFFNHQFPIDHYFFKTFSYVGDSTKKNITQRTKGFTLEGDNDDIVEVETQKKKGNRSKIQNSFKWVVKVFEDVHKAVISENEFESENEEEKKDNKYMSDSNAVQLLLLRKDKNDNLFLENNQYTFFNFIVHNMRIINENLHMKPTIQSNLLQMTHRINSIDKIMDIYQRYSDLIVEMIQGTQNFNFKQFYKKLLEKNQFYNELGLVNKTTLNSFGFLRHCREVSMLLFNPKTIFNEEALPMKTSLFIIINNVISQELYDDSPISIFIVIFPPEKLIALISRYLKALTVKHIENVDYNSKIFMKQYEEMDLNNKRYYELKKLYKAKMNIFEDDYFSLASQIFLFLTILGKKYSIPEADKVINFDESAIKESKQENEDNGGNRSSFYTSLAASQNINDDDKEKEIDIDEKDKIKETLPSASTMLSIGHSKNEVMNQAITVKFFTSITKTCEFVIEKEKKLTLKTIYFIVDPRAFYVSKVNIAQFLDEVDRSSSTTKLKSLIDILSIFMYEVYYKYDLLHESDTIKWMYSIDYKDIDLFNFYMSLIINGLLIMFLQQGSVRSSYVSIFTLFVEGLQILVNIFFLGIYMVSRYKFKILLTKTQYEGRKLTYMDYPRIYLIESLLLNEEVYLMILITVIGIIAIISPYASFLFAFQLLTVIKFVPTIKEIILAFKLRMSQLISMVGFLAILLFFYANIGYTFYAQEFTMDLEGGGVANTCSSLLECAITFFDQGVRADGGIGDLLKDAVYNSRLYWILWVNDMVFFITVILLLLNMMNGVIVSTFSQIREESCAKEDDINNRCFICNIERVEFEKRKLNFAEHQKNEHNVKVYIYFLISLKLIFEKDLDGDQTFIVETINKKEIKCFPVRQTKSIGEVIKDQNDEGNESDEDDDQSSDRNN